MKNYINELKKYMPDIEERLNDASDVEALDIIEKNVGKKLPADFKAIYKKYNGEKNEPYTGMVLGFSLMDTANIIDTLKSFKENDISDVTSMTPDKVLDGKMCELDMIPFAWDGSRGYICIDMSPDKKGKKGQVVTLDYDFDQVTWLADSLKDFFEFANAMLDNGKFFVVNEDESYFEFESGHFFNVMKDVLEEMYGTGVEDDVMIDLPEVFWREYFETDKVALSVIKKTKNLWIAKVDNTVSLEPLTYMDELKELIIHNCSLTDFEKISGAKELKKMVMVNCTFDYEKLEELAKLPKFNQLTLRMMPIKDIAVLAESKSLKQLRLLEMNELDISKLGYFAKLHELELDEIDLDSFEFLNGFKALKVLEIKDMEIPNLDFLQFLNKLTRFKVEYRAQNEEGLKYIKDMKNLKEFDYPVGDMELFKGCEKLTTIGIYAPEFKNPQAVKDSNIYSVMVYDANCEEEVESIVDSLKEYVRITCYGYQGDF